MRITQSGWSRGEEQRVSLHFTGSKEEITNAIDALSLFQGPPLRARLVEEICRALNYGAGTPVNLSAPVGDIDVSPRRS